MRIRPKWTVTQSMLVQEIAKAEHAGEKKEPRRSIGFSQV
jgi:hypothetical protein